nr:cell surface protein [Carnobacterium maltaromaticum]
MKIKNFLLVLFGVIGLVVSLIPTVTASTLPPLSLPINNVFAVPSGANSYVDGNITVITKDIKSQVGSIFSTESNKLDLTQSFHAEMYVYLGDKRGAAADGMAFVMHTDKNRTKTFTGGLGDQLGVYARVGSGGASGLSEQLERSFAIEFDTYYNRETLDNTVDRNADKGHIAYAFPELKSSYNMNLDKVVSLKHQKLYYPTDYLSNGEWHPFSVDWDAGTKELTYKFDDAPAVSVPIDPLYVFGSTSVYWGFTGSTGGSSQESKVAFKQIPGLVNISSSMKVTKDGKNIENTIIPGGNGDIKVQYDLKYNSGKQNLLKPVFNLDLDEFLSFKPGTLTVNGLKISDAYFVDGKLTYDLPKDLTELDSRFTISFEGTPKIVTDKTAKTAINYSITAENYFGNSLKSEFSIDKVNIVTSSYFENQTWLINEINRQLAPKKIDIDVYEHDLAKITKIDLTSAPKVIGEHIPKRVDSLMNLTNLRLANQKLNGTLPEELGNLSKLITLSIYGNTFDSEIPKSIGKLEELNLIALDDNNLRGTVPTAIASLPKLTQIYLNGNKLSGQLPDFPMNMIRIDVRDNQLTYNLATIPPFITSATINMYTKTFIQGLKLTGNKKVSSQNKQIKPFDKMDQGYFDLKAMEGTQTRELFDEHTYVIKNAVDGTVYYMGKKDKAVTIPYQKDISYQIILDHAENNPNNVFIILGKERELKFKEIPVSLSLKIKAGSENQPVIPEGELIIFDDRENKNWKLSVTFSELMQDQRKLIGGYSYIGKNGVSQPIVNGQKFLLETGGSDSINEDISISNAWGSNYGLRYTASNSNHIGNYQGDVIWTLEDTP